jgi:hypothetical protein
VYNLQARTLFVDLRIPLSRRDAFGSSRYAAIRSVGDMDGEELRRYARQHVFAGYSRAGSVPAATPPDCDADASGSTSGGSSVRCQRRGMAGWCVRHHCLDWNYVGVRRAVPNKWWIQLHPGNSDVWREWAYATNEIGHHYYGEEWDRLPSASSPSSRLDDEGIVAFRRRASGGSGEDNDAEDGVLVIVGDHFNYCAGRALVRNSEADSRATVASAAADDEAACASLVDLVDRAVACGEIDVARAWLGRIRGGHGRISAATSGSGCSWTIDTAVEFWREGTCFWSGVPAKLIGDSVDACRIEHGQDAWEVFECSLPSIEELESVLGLPREKSRL